MERGFWLGRRIVPAVVSNRPKSFMAVVSLQLIFAASINIYKKTGVVIRFYETGCENTLSA